MKTTIIRLILTTLLLVACGSTPVLADGGDPPLCLPGQPGCPKTITPLPNGPGDPPLCYPGTLGCPG